MPLKDYGVLRGNAVERRREGSPDDTPHFQIRVVDGDGVDFRIAVNVKSQSAPSELLYLLDDDFRHPITADRLERTCPLPAAGLGPGEVLEVPVTDPAHLGNDGGLITLLDAAGLKVTGVAYTAADARQEGWTVTF